MSRESSCDDFVYFFTNWDVNVAKEQQKMLCPGWFEDYILGVVGIISLFMTDVLTLRRSEMLIQAIAKH